MAGHYEIGISANTSQVVRPMRDLEDTLTAAAEALDEIAAASDDSGDSMQDAARTTERAADDMADSLDDAGRQIARDADDSASKMEKSFRDSLGDIVRAGKDSGDKLGRNVKDGTKKAEDGMEDLAESAQSNAKESAASFRGEFDDVADFITDVVAEAFEGFGPAGVAAGVAAAVGIGALIGSLEASAEKAAEAKDKAIELGQALADVEMDSRLLVDADRLRETLSEIADEKAWYELWQDAPTTVMEELADAAEEFGFNYQQAAVGIAGDSEALAAALDEVNAEIDRQNEGAWEVTDAFTGITTTVGGASSSLLEYRDRLMDAAAEQETAAELAALYTEAQAGVNDALLDSVEVTAEYEAAVAASLDEAGQSWEDYTENGIVNLDAYADAMEAQMAAVVNFEENLVTASGSMSAEALDYIRRMGPDAAPLLQAFIDAPLDEQSRLAGIWDQMGRVTTDSYSQSTELDTAISDAIDAAQGTANGKPVTVKTILESSGLQSAVTNLVNGLHVPAAVVRLRLGQSYE